MLLSYYSNRLESLADSLIDTLKTPLQQPLMPEYVVVQSNGLARWLSMRIAAQLGICSNLSFHFPAAFLWQMFNQVLADVPENSAYESPILTWRVLALLEELPDDDCFAPLHAYLHNNDQHQAYNLAAKIAACFDQYLLYRPDWIVRWQQGEEDHWQAVLWRQLNQQDSDHRVAIQQRFVNGLESVSPDLLPERVAILGISALPPAQVDLFAALGELLDVHLYILNPCQEYWGDILADRDIARRDSVEDPQQQYLEVGNPLLASLGKQGRDFIDLLQERSSSEYDMYTAQFPTTMLAYLQYDILNLQRRGVDCPPTMIEPEDRSLQIHACHSRLRELQILHDQLLALFAANPELQPADIVVMIPDIQAYAPTIEAVFTSVAKQHYIPFSIADRGLSKEFPLLETFFALLSLNNKRYTAEQVLTLLDNNALRRRFKLADSDLGKLHYWVHETAIRWGIDARHREQLQLPASSEHSWEAGLQRLLLGYALPGGDTRLWHDVLPYDEIEGSEAQLLGYFQQFIHSLWQLRTALGKSQQMSDWLSTLHQLLDDFFSPQDNEEDQLQIIRGAIQTLYDHSNQANFNHLVPLTTVIAALRQQLDSRGSNSGFFSGAVTFCTMVPMRSIPFAVVCLLGMNNDSYPRPNRPADFDLMSADFRKGDRSRRQDDRYLFLEALLSARNYLYISYIGNDIRDNSIIPPSVLVSELLDTLAEGFSPADIVTRHPLQAFSQRYFDGSDERLFSYSGELADVSRHASAKRSPVQAFFSQSLPPADPQHRHIELNQLISFYRHSVRYLLRQRLGLRLELSQGLPDTSEPFILDGIASYQLRTKLLPLQIEHQSADFAERLLRAAGQLPHGQVGASLFNQEWQSMQRFSGRIRHTLRARPVKPLEINTSCGDYQLSGWLNDIYEPGLISYRPAKITVLDRLQLWLQHLALNISAAKPGSAHSYYLGLDGDLHLQPVDDARFFLEQLLDLYWQGLHSPLHFFPRSAYAYIEAYRQPKSRADPDQVARRAWHGSDYHRGEGDDPYHRLVFANHIPLDDDFRQLAQAILQPLFEHSQASTL